MAAPESENDNKTSCEKSNDSNQVQDLEVKDAQIIFNSVWTKLVEDYGAQFLRFPKEIFWLNGAPGAGKGTNTDFIMQYRNLTAPPLVVSSLLQSAEAEKMKDAGLLVGDREVVEIMLRKLLDPVYQTGAVVDGFPRTKVQVECVKQLYAKLIELRKKFVGTEHSECFKKPHFHIVVLFVDEKESVRRQIHRGQQAQEHNDEVQESGVGNIHELRPTDLDPQAAINRYRTFKEKTYGALKDLREIFFYHFINAHGSIETVRARIDEELSYQASLELDEATYDQLSCIRVASSLSLHARQELVNRLDAYVERQSVLFAQVVTIVRDDFMPIIERHAISGIAVVNTENSVFHDPDALAMLIDIFSERGFHALVDLQREEIPDSIDRESFKIITREKIIYRVRVHFQQSQIRRGR
jgi:adenylate kinase